ncbi:MAG: TMEM143 family protein [Pirellula sp.]|jgi:hypothetical protein|nr:TMEM143 family protein [Pirellula sp.]
MRADTKTEPAEKYIALHPLELEDRLTVLQSGSLVGLRCWSIVKDDVAEAVHHSVRCEYKHLVREYAFFDPDIEHYTGSIDVGCPVTKVRSGAIIDRLDSLLTRAQYRRLSPADISTARKTASAWGIKLKVRFKDFRRLRVYARGDGIERRYRREWYLMFLRRHLSVPVYRQMVVLFEPKSDQKPIPSKAQSHLCLRMFKNVPHADMDMLLPGSVRISWLESGRIGIPTIWGFAMLVSKLARNLWLLALLGAMKVLTSLTFIAAVVIATAVYGCKIFFSYRHAQNRHLLNVTRSLYYQTLSNNSGVLLRLLDEAEQQQVCQSLLLIYVLERNHPTGKDMHELDVECESLLARLGLGAINFDIRSSLDLLSRLGYVRADEGVWHLSGKPLEAI